MTRLFSLLSEPFQLDRETAWHEFQTGLIAANLIVWSLVAFIAAVVMVRFGI